MATPSYWAVLYWVAVPVVATAAVLEAVRHAQARYGDPKLEGRLLFRASRVNAGHSGLPGAPPYRIWITDREIVLRLRPGYKSRLRTGIETRIPVANLASVVQMPDGKIRVGLKGGEGRFWDFSCDEPGPLLIALRSLHPTPAPQ